MRLTVEGIRELIQLADDRFLIRDNFLICSHSDCLCVSDSRYLTRQILVTNFQATDSLIGLASLGVCLDLIVGRITLQLG